jgi:CDP-diacylglycerol---serine O-phosphatidyltransferase
MEAVAQPHKGLKKGLYLIPAALTAANIGMGFLAILSAMMGVKAAATGSQDGRTATEYFDFAARAIGFAILFDTLDGRIARMTGTSTEIGVQLDSLADVLTFGIAPVVLVYAWAFESIPASETGLHNLAVFALFMYLLCGTFRLARFNLQSTKPQPEEAGPKKYFVGMPIPAGAGVIAALIHFTPTPLQELSKGGDQTLTWLIVGLMGLLGFLMVSTIRYTSFKSLGTGRLPVYPILLVAGFGMMVWLYSQYVLLILATIYLAHGMVGTVVRNLPFRKSAAFNQS